MNILIIAVVIISFISGGYFYVYYLIWSRERRMQKWNNITGEERKEKLIRIIQEMDWTLKWVLGTLIALVMCVGIALVIWLVATLNK